MKADLNFWRFAKLAAAVTMFDTKLDTTYMRRYGGSTVKSVWAAYEQQVAVDGRTLLVSRVVYADMDVDSDNFRHATACRAGFSTVLFRATVNLIV